MRPGVAERVLRGLPGGEHSGGTNTRQRNLHHFSKWLEKTAGCPDPWKSEELVRYGPGKKRPSTLAMEYIKDLLAVTGGGNARNFEDARDHAIFRMLGEGVRRTELEHQQLGDLPSDLIARPFTRVVPLKGAREYQEGRLVAMAPSTARAVVAYLRFRQSHRCADVPALWLGRKGALTGSGVARMIIRRSEQANWDPAHQHQWRHTLVNDLLDGGTEEGDVMRIMGWTDRSMVDLAYWDGRYGESALLAEDGLRYRAADSARVFLALFRARALARTGQREDSRRALAQAEAERAEVTSLICSAGSGS